jgi:hypothetical protein
MTEIKWIELLGKDKNSETVKALINFIEEDCYYSEDDESSFYECKKNGFEIKFNDNRLAAVFLYGAGKAGFNTYKGEIPLSVKFDWSREKIREKLGSPSKSGHAKAFQNVLPEVVWDRYDYEKFLFHISYETPDCLSVDKITLMPPS